MRLSGTKANSTNQYRGLGDQLYDLGGARPTLDLNFANNESLVDSVTGKNLVTHTRASSATYVDGDGNIQTAVTNYLEESEGFNASTYWGTGALRGTATDNAATAPDGSTTATLLVEDTNTIIGRYLSTQHSYVANRTYTVSCWAKQYSNTGTQDRYFGFVFQAGAFGTNQIVAFNITGDGSFTITAGTGTASIEAYPDGWYRCSLTATATTTVSTGLQFRLTNNPNNGSQGYTGDGVSGIYVWGAQLEESSTLGEYVKTTGTIDSAPRFDHDPVTGESLGLLVEEARTNLVSYSAANIGNGWINSTGQTPVNLSLNKLGVFSGVRAISDGATWHGIRIDNFPTLVAGTTYTITDWWMVGDVNPSNKLRSTIKLNGISNTCAVQKSSSTSDPLDPNSYTLTSQATHGTISNLQVEDAGSDVIKLSYNFVPANSGEHMHTIAPLSFTAGESVIALGSQIEEGENPSSYIPTSGSTVTRASDNVSISGNDFGTFNLLEYSEEFDTTLWITRDVIFHPNVITSPNNTFTANKITATGGNTEHNLRRNITITSGDTYTFSCYLKAAGRTSFKLAFRIASLWAGNINQVAIFNLTGDGSVSIATGSPTATIEAVGDGWYRCLITATAAASGTAQVRIQDTFDSDGDGVYVWGAQLEESSTVTPYVKSDVTWTSRASTATYYDYNGVIQTAAVDEARNVAFLPDSNGNFVSAGELLLEDAGTNLLTYSEEFDNGTWTKAKTSITPNVITAPDGTTTADFLVEDTSNGTHYISQVNGNIVSGNTYTISAYIKPSASRGFAVGFSGAAFTDGQVRFNNLGQLLATGASITSYTITPVGDWFRVSATATATATGNGQLRVYITTTTGGFSYQGDGASGQYVWGAQMEESHYATSYIPTSGATATRAADVSSSSSNTFGNSFYDQTESTIYCEGIVRAFSGGHHVYYSFHDGSLDNDIRFFKNKNSEKEQFRIQTSGINELNQVDDDLSYGQNKKSAFAFELDNSINAVNGTANNLDTNVDIPVVDQVDFGFAPTIGSPFMTIKRFTYWPVRVGNDTVTRLTE
jgi:hypothetical protein